MPDPCAAARAAGIAIEVTDLGDWGAATFISEYDPNGPTIRINERALQGYRTACHAYSSSDRSAFIAFAVAHELYHHAEAEGSVVKLTDRAKREAPADAFARSFVEVDEQLNAFLRRA